MRQLNVMKTIKLYIDGQFPRTESGRTNALLTHDGAEYARVCQASRKDVRQAVEVAKRAQADWAKRTAYNKGQIIYRMAEMLEGKREEFVSLFVTILGMEKSTAQEQVDQAIESLIHYAGWTDKFSQVSGSYNMVNGPFHNFTAPAPMGVIAIIEDENFSFGKLLSHIAACITGGNSAIVLLSSTCPAIIAPLAEVFATSDLPPGVINLLTGSQDELLEQFAGHMEIRGLQLMNEKLRTNKKIHELAVDNLKRLSFGTRPSPLEQIELTVEMQTAWHPIGI